MTTRSRASEPSYTTDSILQHGTIWFFVSIRYIGTRRSDGSFFYFYASSFCLVDTAGPSASIASSSPGTRCKFGGKR